MFFTFQLGQLLAATCKELPGPKESRRTAKDLWEVVVQICSVSNQHKRGNDGRVSLIKQRESTLGIMYRYVSLSAVFAFAFVYISCTFPRTSLSYRFVKIDNLRLWWSSLAKYWLMFTRLWVHFCTPQHKNSKCIILKILEMGIVAHT